VAHIKKRKRQGECIYCGKVGPVTDEHVLPDAWYPDDTPPDEWRWQVPACSRCNARYGKMESKILPFLAMSVEPWQRGGKGITEKAWRSLDVSCARDEEHAKKRTHVRELMRRRFARAPLSEVVNALPLGWKQQLGTYATTYVRYEDCWPVFGKIVRGLSYIVSGGQRITEEYAVRIFRDFDLVPLIFRMTPAIAYSCGPGILVQRIGIDPYPMAFYEVVIWNTHRYFAIVMPNGDGETATARTPKSGEQSNGAG